MPPKPKALPPTPDTSAPLLESWSSSVTEIDLAFIRSRVAVARFAELNREAYALLKTEPDAGLALGITEAMRHMLDLHGVLWKAVEMLLIAARGARKAKHDLYS